jgi:hypothetical protein
LVCCRGKEIRFQPVERERIGGNGYGARP